MSMNDFEISDPTDWVQTPLASLAVLEVALRCQVCKEFYQTPVLTECSHTFCSLCIRRALSVDGKCPTCRSPQQASKFRSPVPLGEAVEAFVRARPAMLDLARSQKRESPLPPSPPPPAPETATQPSGESLSSSWSSQCMASPPKRKLDSFTSPVHTDTLAPYKKKLRSSSGLSLRKDASDNAIKQQSVGSAERPIVLDKVDDSGQVVPESGDGNVARCSANNADEAAQNGANLATLNPDSGSRPSESSIMVNCPNCTRQVKHSFINQHLDLCLTGKSVTQPQTTAAPGPRLSTLHFKPATQQARLKVLGSTSVAQRPQPLAAINYDMMPVNALKKKLSELGLLTTGTKAILERRHKEWLNIWNANCDAVRPLGKADLRAQLETWERTQGPMAPTTSRAAQEAGRIRDKNFDGRAWARENQSIFQDLTTRARNSAPRSFPRPPDSSNATATKTETAGGGDAVSTPAPPVTQDDVKLAESRDDPLPSCTASAPDPAHFTPPPTVGMQTPVSAGTQFDAPAITQTTLDTSPRPPATLGTRCVVRAAPTGNATSVAPTTDVLSVQTGLPTSHPLQTSVSAANIPLDMANLYLQNLQHPATSASSPPPPPPPPLVPPHSIACSLPMSLPPPNSNRNSFSSPPCSLPGPTVASPAGGVEGGGTGNGAATARVTAVSPWQGDGLR